MLPGRGSDISVQREGSRSHVGREPFALAPQSGFPSADNSNVEHREILTLACPRCGESFPSAMQMDPTTFDVIRLESMLERCSACGHAARFRKDEYAFTSDRTSP
jgi:ribosomal protein L37E